MPDKSNQLNVSAEISWDSLSGEWAGVVTIRGPISPAFADAVKQLVVDSSEPVKGEGGDAVEGPLRAVSEAPKFIPTRELVDIRIARAKKSGDWIALSAWLYSAVERSDVEFIHESELEPLFRAARALCDASGNSVDYSYELTPLDWATLDKLRPAYDRKTRREPLEGLAVAAQGEARLKTNPKGCPV